MQSTHALKVALGAGDKSYMQYCQYKENCRLQLHVSRHLNPFHPAYMHKKWCRKIDANRQWHGRGRGRGRVGVGVGWGWV